MPISMYNGRHNNNTKVKHANLQNYLARNRRSYSTLTPRKPQRTIQKRFGRRNKIFGKSQEIPIEPLDKCR
jgi:hypothetical protein